MRQDYCEKDGISVTYTDADVCFEDIRTAEALVIANDGEVLINNFDQARSNQLMDWYRSIYGTIVNFRSLDRLEAAV